MNRDHRGAVDSPPGRERVSESLDRVGDPGSKAASDVFGSPLRIALLLHLAPRKLGSLEDWIIALARLLRERGHQVTVFTRGPVHKGFASAFQETGAEWRDIDDLPWGTLGTVRLLRRFDVVHLSFVSPLGRLALAAYLAWPVRVLLVDPHSRRDADLLQPFEGMRPPPRNPGTLKTRIIGGLARRRLGSVAAISEYVRRHARRDLNLPDERVVTIYNGVDVTRFGPTPSSRPDGGVFTILTIAHLIPEKGVHFLVRAFARLNSESARLVVVGDGQDREKLHALSVELGISQRVEFCGLRDDAEQLLSDADIFVHPAVWGEGFGLTIAEAMASGRPVVASRVGAIPELIEDGVSGLLVPPGNIEALCAAIERLIEDPELRRQLATRARKRVEERFSLDRCVEAHAGWCEQQRWPSDTRS